MFVIWFFVLVIFHAAAEIEGSIHVRGCLCCILLTALSCLLLPRNILLNLTTTFS